MTRITTIISEVFRPYVGITIDPIYLELGSVAHTCYAGLCTGQTVSNVDERISGRVNACKSFLATFKPIPIDVEKRFNDMTLGITGKPDLLATIDGKRVIIDHKASLSGYEPIQLAGYGVLTGYKLGMSVQYDNDGKYHTSGIIDISGIWRRRFLAALTCYNTMIALGKIKQQKEIVE
jgi:hypothetical protein